MNSKGQHVATELRKRIEEPSASASRSAEIETSVNVTGFAKMCIVHTKILIRFFDPAYSYTQ